MTVSGKVEIKSWDQAPFPGRAAVLLDNEFFWHVLYQ